MILFYVNEAAVPAGMDAVRLSIDRQYKGIRKVEYVSGASILSTLSILGVKKSMVFGH